MAVPLNDRKPIVRRAHQRPRGSTSTLLVGTAHESYSFMLSAVPAPLPTLQDCPYVFFATGTGTPAIFTLNMPRLVRVQK